VSVQGVDRVAYVLGKDIPDRNLVAPKPPGAQLGCAWKVITKQMNSISNFVLSGALRG
jgi:hypothetical protein